MRHSSGPRHLEVYHDAGFFSCCTVRLRSIIQHFNEFRVLPDVDSRQQLMHYKTAAEAAGEVDITPLFFCTTAETRGSGVIQFNAGNNDEQFSDYRLINHDDLALLVRRYFSPSAQVQRLEHELTAKYAIDPATTVVALYRGGDKHTETILPTHDEMIAKVREVLQSRPGHRLLVQSDEQSFCDRLLQEFGNSFIIEETPRITTPNSAVQYEFTAMERQRHAVVFLATLRIISTCDQIVLNSGNVGLWACLYRGSTTGVHQYLGRLHSGHSGWLL